MLKMVSRVLAAGVSALLLLGATTMPAAAAQSLPNGCEFAPALLSADQTSSKKLASGVDYKSYTFSPGVANGTFLYSKISVSHAKLTDVNLVETNSAIGKSSSQLNLASQVNSLAYVNTDYFNEGNGLPYSAIIKNGVPIYAPAGLSKVVGTIPLNYTLATGFPTSAGFTISASRLVLSGVNLSAVPSDSLVAYTAAFAGTQLPTNGAAVLIKNGKVAAVYKGWTKAKPRSGALLVATGTQASRLLKFKVGYASTLRVPAVPAASTQLKAALVRTNGTVTSGTSILNIASVNYDYSQGSSGVRLYDSNFTDSRYTAHGTYTVSVNSSGLVQARYKPGRDIPVPANGYVLQLNNDGLAFYNASPAGAKVIVKNTFAASHNFKFINASGAGSQVLISGDNQQDCQAFHEQIRPRTAIGWNNATGDVWLMTTSSGQDLNDFGFRMGGSTLHQVFDWLKMLGATDAVTLDGGGSTTMFIQDGTGLKRQDIPDSAWLREVIVGMALVAKD
jgi:hypothetical protein